MRAAFRALIPLAAVSLALAGCWGVPDISVPSIPTFPDTSKSGSASFNINGVPFLVSQSGTIQADFPESKEISFSHRRLTPSRPE